MQQRLCQHIAPELFYVFGPCGSETKVVRTSDVLLKEGTSSEIRTSSTLPWGKSLSVQRIGEV